MTPKSMSIAISGGIWSVNDFGRAIFEEEADIQFVVIQSPTATEIVTAVLGGHVDLGMGTAGQWAQLYQSGDFNVIAMSTEERDPQFPKIPTFKELGYDVIISSYYWIGAPAGTPDSIINFLVDAFQKVSKEQAFREAVFKLGSTPAFQGPEACLRTMEKLNETYLKVIKKYDLKPQ